MNGKKRSLFLSFSGERSLIVARALEEMLSKLLPDLEKFLSDDLDKGSPWREHLFPRLREANLAIVCLTPENLLAPWLHFELGALSKLSKSKVYTYLVGVSSREVHGPLDAFNHTKAERNDTLRMIKNIAEAGRTDSSPNSNIEEAFDQLWLAFSSKLSTACEWQPAPKDAVEAFWAPYWRIEQLQKVPSDIGRPYVRETRIFYTEPRFWQFGRMFYRSLDDNSFDEDGNRTADEAPHLDKVPEQLRGGMRQLPFKCVHQFVSAGEATCIAVLQRKLTKLGIATILSVSRRRHSDADLIGDNLIIIGNVRTHWAIHQFQHDLPIKVERSRIVAEDTVLNTRTTYEDDDPGTRERNVYAVVTRRQDGNRSVTVLAANNGRAFEGVGAFLCSTPQLRRALPSISELSTPLPATFQLLLRIRLEKDDTAASYAELVMTHGFVPTATLTAACVDTSLGGK
jgi:hypothetical protein